MAELGNPNSVSGAGVGALCARTAVKGFFLNVIINAADCIDHLFVEETIKKAEKLLSSAKRKEAEILKIVYSKIES